MAKYEGSVPYTGFIAPADDTDTFNVTDERFNKGGYRSVINQVERLAITPERRKEGMLVKQLDTGGYWTLEGGITNNDWVEPEFANSAIADRLYQPDGTNAFVYTDNSGNLHIDGNIIQNGASYETHAEKLYTTRDFIITRENAVSALAVGALSGIQVTKYDGLNDLIFGTDKNGFFKVGEPSNLQTVGTRQDSPIAKGLGYYNEALYRWDTTAHMKFNTTSNNLEVSGIKLGTLGGLLNATAGVIGTTTLKTINSQSIIGSGNIVINSEDLRWNGGSTGLNAATGRASLGLGTAATKDVQTSSTASTGVMEVGAFGLGGNPIILTGSEWDVTSMPNQFVRATNSFDSIFNRAGVGIHLGYSGNYAAQLFMAVTGTLSIKARTTSSSGVWGDEEELYHTGNLVNPVTGTGTSGQISYWNGSGNQTGSSNLVWDNTNGRLSISSSNTVAGFTMLGSNIGISQSNYETNGIVWKNFGYTKMSAGLLPIDTGAYSKQGLGFYTGDDNNTTTDAQLRMSILRNGNVLIGGAVSIGKTSITSGYMLDVNGAIIATGGNSSNWNTAYTDRLKWDGGSTGLNATTGRASLGLGTAATKDVQTSSTASTGVMEVGAFGLGETSVLLQSISDLNLTNIPSGLHGFASTASNNPTSSSGTMLVMRSGASSYFTQLAQFINANNINKMMFRHYRPTSSAYSTWQELYHTGNLVNPVTGTGSSGRVAFWNSSTGLTKSDDFLFDGTTLRLANGTGGRGVEITKNGLMFKASGTGGWAMQLTTINQSNGNIGNIVGGYGGANSFSYAYLGGTAYDNAALYAHSDNSVSINKKSVTSGYKLDINGATAMTGLKVGTISGTTRMNGGVMEAASIIISTSEPTTSGRLNGDIWVKS